MRKVGGGSIISTASVAGIRGFASLHAYCAAKAGVVNLTRSAALEFAKDKIRVNCICPGGINTPILHRNQPGVLSAINAVFSGEKINIAGQYLQTNAKIGYVVIDVETGERAASLQVKNKLEEVPGPIRTRILY